MIKYQLRPETYKKQMDSDLEKGNVLYKGPNWYDKMSGANGLDGQPVRVSRSKKAVKPIGVY